VKIATTKAQRKLFFNLRSLKHGLETLRPHEVKAIASELNVSERDVVEMETRFSGHDMALDPTANDDEDRHAPIAWLATDGEDEPSQQLERSQADHLQTEGLHAALAALDARSRRIVEARWLDEEGAATLHQLAAEFNVSAERIRQIEQKALRKIQYLLAPELALLIRHAASELTHSPRLFNFCTRPSSGNAILIRQACAARCSHCRGARPRRGRCTSSTPARH
jgi:RNA polymerase sigma-32 factor